MCHVILQLALLWGYYGGFCNEILNITNTAVDVKRYGAFEFSKYFRRRKSGTVEIFLQLWQLLDFTNKPKITKNV